MKSPERSSLPSDLTREFAPLPSHFYHGDTISIARSLLGKGLYRRVGDEVLLAEICEVEAYLGSRIRRVIRTAGYLREMGRCSKAGALVTFISRTD